MAHISLLKREKADFFVNSPCISGQAAVRADYTVAWDDHRDSVVAYCAADGLRGHVGASFFLCQLSGDISVCHGITVWDRHQNLPYLFLKIRSDQVKRHFEIRFFP